jgi:uncharacterized protein YndB with AHSA1/START domain
MESNTKDRELSVSRVLNAPIDLVWEVFATPEHIMQWWGPEGFTNTLDVMDFVPGGEWKFIMHGPNGTDFSNLSVFKEIVVNEQIVFEHFNPHIMFTIGFEKQGDKTLLNWHMLFDTAKEFEAVAKANGAVEGLQQNIVKLEAYLASRS